MIVDWTLRDYAGEICGSDETNNCMIDGFNSLDKVSSVGSMIPSRGIKKNNNKQTTTTKVKHMYKH